MIRKLQIKFIALSMAALFVLLAVILTGMNAMNYRTVIVEADTTLLLLAKNGGIFPDFEGDKKGGLPGKMSREAPYEARYFSVLLDASGNVVQTNTSKIRSIDTEQAIDYAVQILESGKEEGFIDEYRYVTWLEGDQIRITFLNCEQKLNFFYSSLFVSLGIVLTGYLLFFLVIVFFSGRIMRPVAESYEKQKRFITDAGHEIKTPLTIIQADVDVLEMELGENEWLSDIQKQAVRLTSLTNDLVYLSRMEEGGDAMPMIEFPFSDVVSEAASSFQALAQTQGKTFECNIQPMLSLNGNEKAVQQLVGILLDNALKYSPENGMVSLKAWKQSKTLWLSVLNTTEQPMEKDKLDLLFERFYRTDPSRNSQTGGYGIGLSVAKAIVSAHGGKIQARTEDGMSLLISASFPM